ncbi:hypothetical protein BRD00_07725 [Halobacteriales archaeon QS_8_69_26]|nr:MAG: hypothetical protein BRD00_07725 [Halobacteriales archaeon QS_8_69_26]
MQEWGWAIASVILLVTLVQLLAYYYLVRGGGPSMLPSSADGNGNASPGGPGRADAVPGAEDRDVAGLGDAEEVRRCSNCGAPNESDPVFSFCRNCGDQL